MYRHLLVALTIIGTVSIASAQSNPALQSCSMDLSGAPPMEPPFFGDAGPGAQLFFPNHGTVNILIVFVQHLDDTFEDCHDTTQLDEDGVPIQIDPNICYQGPDIPTATSWTDDEATEWPVYWSQEPDRRLPIWAENGFIASPDTDPFCFLKVHSASITM